MCWIPTSAVHRFRWVNSCFEATIVTSSEHLNESTISVVCHLFIAKVSPEWRLNPGFGTQTKCPFPLNRGVFPGQNFVPWMEEVSQRRGSIVIGCGMEEFSLSKIRRRPALEKNVSFRSIRASNLQTGLSILFHSRKMVFVCGMQGKRKLLQIGYRHCFYSFIPFHSIHWFIYLLNCLFFFQIKERDWTATGEVSIPNDESLLLCAELDRWV